jgi:hypothetical protein
MRQPIVQFVDKPQIFAGIPLAVIEQIPQKKLKKI